MTMRRGIWWWWGLLFGITFGVIGIGCGVVTLIAAWHRDWDTAMTFGVFGVLVLIAAAVRMGLWGGPLTNGRFEP